MQRNKSSYIIGKTNVKCKFLVFVNICTQTLNYKEYTYINFMAPGTLDPYNFLHSI